MTAITPQAPADGSLAGVAVATTQIAHVDGLRGEALIRGYRLPELAEKLTFEQVAQLVIDGELPTAGEASAFREQLAREAPLAAPRRELASALGKALSPPEALVAAAPLVEGPPCDERAAVVRALARVPSVCAAVHGHEAPDGEASYAARALRALGGRRLDAPALRAFEVLLSLEAEHGLSASTFACRVAASSGAGAGVCLSAAIATLTGPRHGGATAEARGLLRRAAESGDAKAFAAAQIAQKARLPGFGHRIYKVADPRVPPLRRAMHQMGDAPLLDVAEAMLEVVAERLGPKGVHANIDLFGAALLDALGVGPERYVAAFAVGLAPGWLSHWREQRATGKLTRPESTYAGPAQRDVP